MRLLPLSVEELEMVLLALGTAFQRASGKANMRRNDFSKRMAEDECRRIEQVLHKIADALHDARRRLVVGLPVTRKKSGGK